MGEDPVQRSQSLLPLVAYRLEGSPAIALVTAPRKRQWMDSNAGRRVYFCLPMVLANQAGWFMLNSHSFKVRWTGGDGVDALEILYLTGRRPFPAVSSFGNGILTFQVPYVFRTPPGCNLLVRGPANCPKDGASPLEGLVETDWSSATFTMNWQITRPNHTVFFEEHEPIGMIVPQRRGSIEQFRPEIRPIESDHDLSAKHAEWARSRRNFIGAVRTHPVDVDPRGLWQGHYFRGTSVDGSEASEHQRSLRILPFSDASAEGGRSDEP
jgi:hypothetical protein